MNIRIRLSDGSSVTADVYGEFANIVADIAEMKPGDFIIVDASAVQKRHIVSIEPDE